MEAAHLSSAGNTNLSVIQNRWPEVWMGMQESPLPKDWSVSQQTPEPTLIIQGLQLTSAYNRIREAQLQASILPSACREVFVYGMAFGDLVRVLLENQDIQKVIVVSLHPGIDRLVLLLSEELDWLQDSRVELILGSREKTLRWPWVVLPAYLRLASPDSLALRDQLVLELNQAFQNEYFDRLGELYRQRLEENRNLVESDGDIGSLFGSKPNGKFMVVAAGPTLESNLGWMQCHRAEITLVTVTRALKPLIESGIVPDVVLALDHSPSLLHHVQGLNPDPLSAVILAYTPVVSPDLLHSWPGPRLAFYLNHPLYAVLAEQQPHEYLYSSGTVVHAAIDLSVRMGAQQITMVGVDFGYPFGMTHATGVVFADRLADEKQHHFSTLNGFGNLIPTDANFLGYIRDLELYFSGHPEVRFLKRGKAGAALQGAEWIEE